MTSPVAGAAAKPLLQIRNLRKFFPITAGFFRKTVGQVRAVDDVNFDVHDGETLGLVGESGCGKTTTSRCIMRAIAPTSGQILFRRKNEEIVDLAPMTRSELRPLRAEIQMIFQDPFGSLNPRMTLLDNVGEPLLVNGMTNRASGPIASPSCCGWSDCGRSSCTAFPMRSAADSASASASRARFRPIRGWLSPTSRSRRWMCRCRRRSSTCCSSCDRAWD